MPLVQRVFNALADGKVHSGEQLAAGQSVSRSAIWKAVGTLTDLGVAVEATPRLGYRLAAAVVPLAAAQIMAGLEPEVRARVRRGEVEWTLTSTNDALLARGTSLTRGPQPASHGFDFLAAEIQTAGRGRRARPWVAPPGGALCLSVGWQFDALPKAVSALSLAVGVCALRALATTRGTLPSPGESAAGKFSSGTIKLKWPNDLMVGEQKLGGILIELRAESSGPAYVTIGIGINCALSVLLIKRVQGLGTEPTDLAALGVTTCDRNQLCAALVNEIVSGVLDFEREGLAAFAPEWRAADVLVGRQVRIAAPGGEVEGVACGIDADGALCVQSSVELVGHAGLLRFHSGEVTVRPVT